MAHRVQGNTVDTAHALITGTLYVDTDHDPDVETRPGQAETITGRVALETALR